MNDVQLHFVISIIFENIKTVKIEEYVEYMEEAKNLAPHERDIPYFALALAKNCAIWSNEKAFKKQQKVKVFSTNDLKTLLKLIGSNVFGSKGKKREG